MDLGTALVVIAGIGAFYSLKSQRLRGSSSDTSHGFRRRGRGGHAPQPDQALPSPREAELQQEVESLRERIHVLERIATDANSSNQRQTRQLADEIESLRDR